MKQYLNALNDIMSNGEMTENRTDDRTKSIFGMQMRFNLQDGFPAVTSKKLAWKAVVSELLWFLEGSQDERRLAEILYNDKRENLTDKRTIWSDNADNQGKALGYENNVLVKELGPVYGVQWRDFNEYSHESSYGQIDQIDNIIKQIKNTPDSRRIILSAWNPNQLDKMALPPCHVMSQFRVINGKLSCHLYQRSADMFLGVPFNIASYSLLTHILAGICDLEVGDFVWSGGDCHIYESHFDAVIEQLTREPLEKPTLKMPQFKTLEDVIKSNVNDYELLNYKNLGQITAKMII